MKIRKVINYSFEIARCPIVLNTCRNFSQVKRKECVINYDVDKITDTSHTSVKYCTCDCVSVLSVLNSVLFPQVGRRKEG